MSESQLSATIRDKFGKQANFLRKKGIIPAVLYGHGKKTISLSVDFKEFSRAFKEAGESTIINLNIEKDGKIETQPVLIHEIDFDPVSDLARHIDFYVVKMDEVTTVMVPLVFVGESPAVKALGGILIKNLHEVRISALPKDLPHEIVIDISAINTFQDHIYLKNLQLSHGVKILDNLEEVAALVKPPRTEEELKALEGEVKVDVEAVKVESEEKKKEKEAEVVAMAEEIGTKEVAK